MLQPQQLTGLSERKRSTGGKNSEAFRALGWTADGENRSLVYVFMLTFFIMVTRICFIMQHLEAKPQIWSCLFEMKCAYLSF